MTNNLFYTNAAHVFKVIGHPLRLEILSILAQHETCVEDLQNYTQRRQANISQHLGLLRREGLVTCKKRGKRIYYSKLPYDTNLIAMTQLLAKSDY